MWRQGAAIGKKPRVAGFSSGGNVLRPEGSELGRALGGTDGLDGELLQLPGWNPTNTSNPLYPPFQPEMLYRARIGGGGEGSTYICANITKYSLLLCKYHPRWGSGFVESLRLSKSGLIDWRLVVLTLDDSVMYMEQNHLLLTKIVKLSPRWAGSIDKVANCVLYILRALSLSSRT